MRLKLNIGIFICILLMTQTAFAYADMAQGATVETTSMPSISPANGESSIAIMQQLIEVELTNPEYTVVRETIIFTTVGNYTTDLMVWIPDGTTEIIIERQEMTEGSSSIQLQYTEEGNIVRFNDEERLNTPGMPPMYTIQYVISGTANDDLPKYTKVLQYPTYINYPVSNLLLKVIPAQDMEFTIKDEGGNIIQGDNVETGVNEIVHTWSAPQFKEFTVKTKTSSNVTGILPYVIIGFIILAVLAFPFVQKKMKKNDGNDNVFVESTPILKEEDVENKVEDDDSDEIESEMNIEDEDEITIGKSDLNELETRYDAVLSVLNEIKNDKDNGEISDEEYEIVSKKYKSEAIDLMKTIDELQEKLGL